MRVAEPSERNYLLYLDVEFLGMSLRAAAAKYEISPTRVQQIVAQTRVWYRETTPQWVQEIDPGLQPVVACRLHEDRLEHLYSQAMTSWTESQGRKSVQRKAGTFGDQEVVVTKDQYGEVRYLAQATKISEARLNASLRSSETAQLLPRLVAPPALEAASSVSEPPSEGCAQETSLPQEITAVLAEMPAVNTWESSGCEFDELTERHAPASVLDFPNPVRTRKERKRRQRELARKRRA